MYPANTVASYFIKLSIDENVSLSPMKLQKLVYFAHGFYLALFDKPLIYEPIEAWKYGPVIPTLYHQFKFFGNQSIKDSRLFALHELNVLRSVIDIADEDKEFLNFIWKGFSRYSAEKLSMLTHLENTPWHRTIQGNNGKITPNLRIADSTMKEHFKTKYKTNELQTAS